MMTEEQIVARLLAGRLDKPPAPKPPKPPEEKAQERWSKPRSIHSVIADTLAHTQALLTRLEAGVYAPTDKRSYEVVVRDLYLQTQKQLAALSACSKLKSLE
jgi:hypothetical protein